MVDVNALETEARRLVQLYDDRIRATHALALADQPTGAQSDTVLEAGRLLDAACEAFRRRHYPRAGRVCVGLWAVFAQSSRGRSVTTVLDLHDEYSGAPA